MGHRTWSGGLAVWVPTPGGLGEVDPEPHSGCSTLASVVLGCEFLVLPMKGNRWCLQL